MKRTRAQSTAYVGAMIAVALSTFATFALRPLLGPSVSLLFFPAVVVSAVYGGYGPGTFATILSTAAIAYFFVPPLHALDIGGDDALRLVVFGGVASGSAWLRARRRSAEEAQRTSLRELEQNLLTLQRVSRWPLLIGPDAAAGVRRMLEHASSILGADKAAVAWEADDEPWVYLADTTGRDGVAKQPVAELGEWRSEPPHVEIVRRIGDESPVSAVFETEHVSGRVYFTGMKTPVSELTLTLIAHEVGNSLGQLHLSERLRQLAVHEDRIRVSRDLHDGVLQALTGIRLELQAIAESAGPLSDRMRALERALAIEQRELRLFIDELRPTSRASIHVHPVATRLGELCSRLSAEWKVPVSVRVTPPDVRLPDTIEQALRLMIHEGVSNALKHAHPSRVSIDVDATASHLRVAIADDGLGFSFRGRLEHEELAGFGAGPVSLRERVSALDGHLSIESTPTGSRVEFVIPIRGHVTAAP